MTDNNIFDKLASQMKDLKKTSCQLEKTRRLYEESLSRIPTAWDNCPFLMAETYRNLNRKLCSTASSDARHLLCEMKINDLTGRIAKLEVELADLKRRSA